DQLGQIKTDFSDEEDENTFKNTTYVIESCDDPDTYDITAYEDYEESLQYRKRKLIPSWASNASELELSLFVQQPELMKLTFPGDDPWRGWEKIAARKSGTNLTEKQFFARWMSGLSIQER
ncbi:unnamed protein product, partial [Allacma fusca]